MRTFPSDKHVQRNFALKAIQSGRIECPGIMFYKSFFEAAQYLTQEEVGQLVIALGMRRFKHIEPDMPDNRAVAIAYSDAKVKADNDLINYAVRVLKNQYHASGKRAVDSTGKERVIRDEFEVWFDARYGSRVDDYDCDQWDSDMDLDSSVDDTYA